jgi:tetratricopeptide (TPR) repeat protein
MSGSALSSYQQGLEAASRGDTAGAQRAFQSALSADSSAFRAAYNLGVLADRSGDEDQALTYYRQALRIQPDFELAVEGVVTIYVRRHQADQAVSFTQPIAQQYVRNLAVQAIYGEALVEARRYQDAITAARGALRRDERCVPAMIVMIKANRGLERHELARSILDQALGIDPNNAELHYLHGVYLQDDGQLAQAMQEYGRAVELRPDYVEAHMRLGLQNLVGGNYDSAVQHFETVSHLVPDQWQVHLNLGDAYRSTKQYEKAQTEYDTVQRMQPSNAQVHYDLGLMYMAQSADATGQQQVDLMRRAQTELTSYRTAMGASLPRDDQSTTYLDTLQRQIERAQKALDRAAARAAKQGATDAGPADAGTGGSP